MIFKKEYGDLINQSIERLLKRTDITNTTVGGITRSILEVMNLNVSEYYNILDLNTAMAFVSTAEGYFLDLIADLFGMTRMGATSSSASAEDMAQKFYVTTGTLTDRIPSNIIPQGTEVSTTDGNIKFTVSSSTSFSPGATEVYAPITSNDIGSEYNVGVNALIVHNLGISDVYTTNEKIISGARDVETDENFRFRIVNATLTAERANETSVRLAALSTAGVGDIIIRPYARGIGTFEVIVIPAEGIATDGLVAAVQANIDEVKACGTAGYSRKPLIVPVDLEVRLVFQPYTNATEQASIRQSVRSAISQYIVNIPIGGEFILNELRQRIMDVSDSIKDHIINCYYFREQPTFLGNVSIYWDEMFYPNPSSSEAIIVL